MASVEVRFGQLDVDEAEVARCHGLIDKAERERAALFRYARDRRRFIVRRGRLREWLAERVGQPPERLVFTTSEFGMRTLADTGPRFSTSHSGEYMMAAFADTDIGCDIERTDQEIEWRAIVEQLFAPGERKTLGSLLERSGRAAFFDCWVRKEAFVKALGLGVSYPFDAFDMSVSSDTDLPTVPGWSIAAVSPGSGYAGTVIVRDDGAPFTVRTLGERQMA